MYLGVDAVQSTYIIIWGHPTPGNPAMFRNFLTLQIWVGVKYHVLIEKLERANSCFLSLPYKNGIRYSDIPIPDFNPESQNSKKQRISDTHLARVAAAESAMSTFQKQ